MRAPRPPTRRTLPTARARTVFVRCVILSSLGGGRRGGSQPRATSHSGSGGSGTLAELLATGLQTRPAAGREKRCVDDLQGCCGYEIPVKLESVGKPPEGNHRAVLLRMVSRGLGFRARLASLDSHGHFPD